MAAWAVSADDAAFRLTLPRVGRGILSGVFACTLYGVQGIAKTYYPLHNPDSAGLDRESVNELGEMLEQDIQVHWLSRHPNIVQLYGVAYDAFGTPLWLVSELSTESLLDIIQRLRVSESCSGTGDEIDGVEEDSALPRVNSKRDSASNSAHASVTASSIYTSSSFSPHLVAAALPVARAIFSALAYLHARGLAHGNIKPSNIMRTSSGMYKLSDMHPGAFRSALSHACGIPVDSSLYSAPESWIVRENQGTLSPELRSPGARGSTLFTSPSHAPQRASPSERAAEDVWSAGLVLARLGQQEDPPHDYENKVLYASSSHVDGTLATIVCTCVQLDALSRTSSAAVFDALPSFTVEQRLLVEAGHQTDAHMTREEGVQIQPNRSSADTQAGDGNALIAWQEREVQTEYSSYMSEGGMQTEERLVKTTGEQTGDGNALVAWQEREVQTEFSSSMSEGGMQAMIAACEIPSVNDTAHLKADSLSLGTAAEVIDHSGTTISENSNEFVHAASSHGAAAMQGLSTPFRAPGTSDIPISVELSLSLPISLDPSAFDALVRTPGQALKMLERTEENISSFQAQLSSLVEALMRAAAEENAACLLYDSFLSVLARTIPLHPDSSVHENVLRIMSNLVFKNPANQQHMLQSTGVVEGILRLMNIDGAVAGVQENGCRIFGSLALCSDGWQKDWRTNTVETATRALQACGGHVGVALRASALLCNLCTSTETQIAAVKAGALQHVVASMGRHLRQAGVQEQGCRALRMMVGKNMEHLTKLREAGGLAAIIRSMFLHWNNAAVIEHACRALRDFCRGGSGSSGATKPGCVAGSSAIENGAGGAESGSGTPSSGGFGLRMFGLGVVTPPSGRRTLISPLKSKGKQEREPEHHTTADLDVMPEGDSVNDAQIIYAVIRAMGAHPGHACIQEQCLGVLRSLSYRNSESNRFCTNVICPKTLMRRIFNTCLRCTSLHMYPQC